MQCGFESVLAELLADVFNGMNVYVKIFGDTSILVVGAVRVSLEQDAGSSNGLGWVFASSGEAGQKLTLLVGQDDSVLFHQGRISLITLPDTKRVTIQ